MKDDLKTNRARILERIRAYPDHHKGKQVIIEFCLDFDTQLLPPKRSHRVKWELEHAGFSMAEMRLCDGHSWTVVLETSIGLSLMDERPLLVTAQAVVLVDDDQSLGLRVVRIDSSKPAPKGWWGRIQGFLQQSIRKTH